MSPRIADDSQTNDSAARMRTIVDFLCSDRCLPRLPGTPGGLAARQFVVEAFANLGLEPAGEDVFLQHIPAVDGANVLGRRPGRSDRSIIVGAHFDACRIDGGINPGANDNAASVAVMLEVARAVMLAPQLGRTVVFVGFDAEEPPYFQTPNMGSRRFVEEEAVSLRSVDLMICLDVIGHAIGNNHDAEIAETVFVLGANKSPQVGRILAQIQAVPGLIPRRLDVEIMDQVSDYAAFQDAGVPFLFYNNGRNEHYHATTDTSDFLDFDKMSSLTEHLIALVIAAANAPSDPFLYKIDGADHGPTIETVRAVLPTLPPSSRFADKATGLLDVLAKKQATDGLTAREWQMLRRVFNAIEDGLQDARLW
jgi:peptidase M28-like protein